MPGTKEMTAVDLMQKEVVTIAADESLREALALMTSNHVSGLPVIDSHNRCVGIVSATDILGYEEEQAEFAEQTGMEEVPYFDPESQRWESFRPSTSLEEMPEIPVAEVMSRDLVSVPPDMSVRDVAKRMLVEDVHRILVLDDKDHLYGIIAAFDFVRLYAGD